LVKGGVNALERGGKKGLFPKRTRRPPHSVKKERRGGARGEHPQFGPKTTRGLKSPFLERRKEKKERDPPDSEIGNLCSHCGPEKKKKKEALVEKGGTRLHHQEGGFCLDLKKGKNPPRSESRGNRRGSTPKVIN